MDFDKAIQAYVDTRNKIAAIDRRAKEEAKPLKEHLAMLEAWVTQQADKQGLKNVPTPHGTGYWSTHSKCSVASPDDFFEYVKENERWDLIEKRASKTAVAAEVKSTGEPPPGVNFSQHRAFNVRAVAKGELDDE